MSEYRNLNVEIGEGLAEVTIDRPEVLNALDRTTMLEIDRVFESLDDNPEVRVVILTGGGDRAFVAGADIREFEAMTVDAARDSSRTGQAILMRIENLSCPVIAAVHGFALGGGCELAMACHLRVVGARAKLGLPEVSLGILPGYGGTQRLARLVGRGKAADLVLTGEMIDGREAYRIGLAERLVDPDDLPADKAEAAAAHREAVVSAARALAATIMRRGPVAVRYSLEAIRRGADGSMEEGQALEASLFGLSFATEDRLEGAAAFLEKREPKFKGC